MAEKNLNKKQRKKKIKLDKKRTIKASKMSNGDRNMEIALASIPIKKEKIISSSQAFKLSLENLTEDGLKKLVSSKCIISNLYDKNDITVNELSFYTDNGFNSMIAFNLNYSRNNDVWEYIFEFRLSPFSSTENSLVQIKYSQLQPSDYINTTNPIITINPRKLNARKLLNIINF